jgi:aminoglycoside 6'-N-acetyltransferase I
LGAAGRQQAAEVLVAAFAADYPASWTSLADGLAEVEEFFAEGRLARAALGEGDRLLGWIGAISGYNGHAWELHPLAVHPDFQRRGIGAALVRDLEEQVRARGAITLYLGSDDETGTTSLGGGDLYPDVLAKLAALRNLGRQPFTFYQKLGYSVVGVLPDANGFGRPDIFMAKRIEDKAR